MSWVLRGKTTLQSYINCSFVDTQIHLIFSLLRGSPTLVQALPGPSVQVTAGSNHTAILLVDGQVFTFGSFSVSKQNLLQFYRNAKVIF